ncbi:response regulator [Enterovibrio norvegicus FF-33]|uniref:Response regulator n=1 Tax=Enterovibrio norvegicus FF-454 TaxID=1185651 RepID=A0A1E5CF82_9GAMM|nr:fused response regulator/phosphatase [Enterovibrio norvegicus]OEE64161.1 response regulator [Enterovibrio norvegicus FF-454]OEE70495.1 response regulator [Enterovibrio norvegicus FF-33]OEE76634.1 response regulator [Enterovibrio norvegicus FF-162]
MKVLIVEDEISLQCFLEHVLKDEFDELLIADNGQIALDMLESMEELPNIVIMDVLMPEMDGFEAAKQIRMRYKSAYLPIIFLTGITDNDAFNRCMTLGDDFLTKPISRTTIVAKVRAHCRNVRLYNEVAIQRDKLKHFQAHTLYEHTMAETIFSNLMQGCYQEAEGVSFYTSSYTNFNGDVVLVTPRPQGGIYAMLADATGHGLPAAISSIPATKAFFAMTKNGFALGDIVKEMNSTLKTFLPPGMLVAANLLEVSANGLDINWWGGGMPDGYIIDRHGEIKQRLPSAHMALGAMDSDEFEANLVALTLEEGDKLFFFTDGVTEARNAEGHELGEEGLEALISTPSSNVIDMTREHVAKFTSGGGVGDDMSMLELTAPIRSRIEQQPGDPDYYDRRSPAQLNVYFGAKELRKVNLVGEVRRMLKGTLGSNIDLDLMCTVLSELTNNALEHGLLKLESSLKSDDDGFLDYYMERQSRLEALDAFAYMEAGISFNPTKRELSFYVTHNGEGFWVDDIDSTLEESLARCGRGIALVTELCEFFTYEDEGRTARGTYKLASGMEYNS